MWISLIFKNIKSFIKGKPFLFFFIIISQVVCIASVLAVAGFIDAATPVPKDDRGYSSKSFYLYFYDRSNNNKDWYSVYDTVDEKYIYIGTDEDEYQKVTGSTKHLLETNIISDYTPLTDRSPQFKDLKSSYEKIMRRYGDKIADVSMIGYTDKEQLTSFWAIGEDDLQNERHKPLNTSDKNPIILIRSEKNGAAFADIKQGDILTLGSTGYKVEKAADSKGTMFNDITLLFTDVDDSFYINDLAILMKDEVGQETISEIYDIINDEMGAYLDEMELPQPKPLLEKQFNNMIYVLAFIMIAVVILNIARLYTYIMSTRKKTLAVFSICGATKLKITMIYISEILITMLISFAAGCLIFHTLLIAPISNVFPSFSEFFNAGIYLMIFGIYMITGLIIMSLNLIPVVRRSVNSLVKGGE